MDVAEVAVGYIQYSALGGVYLIRTVDTSRIGDDLGTFQSLRSKEIGLQRLAGQVPQKESVANV